VAGEVAKPLSAEGAGTEPLLVCPYQILFIARAWAAVTQLPAGPVPPLLGHSTAASSCGS
jgi:hypothetical protein